VQARHGGVKHAAEATPRWVAEVRLGGPTPTPTQGAAGGSRAASSVGAARVSSCMANLQHKTELDPQRSRPRHPPGDGEEGRGVQGFEGLQAASEVGSETDR
jgi:hypothetical protein